MANLMEPGTLLVLLAGGVILAGMFGWVQEGIHKAEEQSERQRDNAIECSSLAVTFRSVSSNATHTSVLFEANQELPGMLVTFHAPEKNYTREVRNIEPGVMERAEAASANVTRVETEAPNCDRVFSPQ